MAFQTGTQVRPELGRADVSGFSKGGMAIGQGLMLAGEAVAAMREKKADKVREKILNDKAANTLFQLDQNLGTNQFQNKEEAAAAFTAMGTDAYDYLVNVGNLKVKQDELERKEGQGASAQTLLSITNLLNQPPYKDVDFDEEKGVFFKDPMGRDNRVEFPELLRVPGMPSYIRTKYPNTNSEFKIVD
jgi:hypothetical protein